MIGITSWYLFIFIGETAVSRYHPLMRPELTFLLALAIGIHALITGIRYLRGSYKAPYFAQASLGMYAEMGVSLGIMALIIALLVGWGFWLPPVPPAVGLLVYVGLAGIAINWLLGIFGKAKPAWVVWVEDNTDHQLQDSLRYHAQSMGLKVWDAKTQSQSDLEAWVEEVRVGLAHELTS